MTRPARPAINAFFLEPGMGGLETYVRELVGELVRARPDMRLTLLVNREGRQLLAQAPWAREVEFLAPPLLSRRGMRMVTELTLMGWLASERFDVLHSPALTAPLATKAANVVVLADVTWLVAPTGSSDVILTERMWRAAVPTIARRADRVVAISASGADQVVERLRVPRERIEVIPLGKGSSPSVEGTPKEELRRRLGLGEGPVILNVAAKKAHKNQSVLIDALARLGDVHADARLVLAGAPGEYEAELRELVRRSGQDDRVVFCDYVESEDLEGLFGLATCFAFPSLNEGFGLPLLEAMERGVPVACSNLSALPEVAGPAALQFDPHDPRDVAATLERLLSDADLRSELVTAGFQRQAGFTWAATAEQTLECWERTLAQRR